MTRRGQLALALPAAFALAACDQGASVSEGDAKAVAPAATTEAAPASPLVMAADTARIMGSASAPVWLVMASDFQCPACRYWHMQESAGIMRDYVATGKVRFAYINFPLDQHLNAVPASEAAMCAGAQGRFWPVHDAIFASQERWANMPDAVPFFRELAVQAGVDTASWNRCLVDNSLLPLIEGDLTRGRTNRVNQTPTFFVGSTKIDGAIPAARLRPILDSALAAAGRGSTP